MKIKKTFYIFVIALVFIFVSFVWGIEIKVRNSNPGKNIIFIDFFGSEKIKNKISHFSSTLKTKLKQFNNLNFHEINLYVDHSKWIECGKILKSDKDILFFIKNLPNQELVLYGRIDLTSKKSATLVIKIIDIVTGNLISQISKRNILLSSINNKIDSISSQIDTLISTVKNDDRSIKTLDLHGELDIYNALVLKEQMNELLAQGHINFIFNFNDLTYIDSSATGVFIHFASELKKNNGKMVLINVKGTIQTIFELTKLNEVFIILNSESEAIALIKNK